MVDNYILFYEFNMISNRKIVMAGECLALLSQVRLPLVVKSVETDHRQTESD